MGQVGISEVGAPRWNWVAGRWSLSPQTLGWRRGVLCGAEEGPLPGPSLRVLQRLWVSWRPQGVPSAGALLTPDLSLQRWMDSLNSDERSTPQPGELVEVGHGGAHARTGVGSLGSGSAWRGRGGSAWPVAVDLIYFCVHALPVGRHTGV